MRRRALIVSATLLASGWAAAATPGPSTWDIDTSQATASFSIKHMMIANVTGKAGPVSGVVTLDTQDLSKSKVNATVDMTRLDTGNAKRDAHLKSKDFFDVQKYPTATFVSTEVTKTGDGLRVTGKLTLHGKSKAVTLDVKLSNEVMNPFTNGLSRGVVATGTLRRSDFGLTWQMPMANNGVLVGEEAQLRIDLEIARRSN